jgi:isoleucyl-tRNA synthetase
MVDTSIGGSGANGASLAYHVLLSRYSGEWEKTVHRLGRWIDFENDYKTLDPTFMESVWWVFSELYAKGLVYRGFKASGAQCMHACKRHGLLVLIEPS